MRSVFAVALIAAAFVQSAAANDGWVDVRASDDSAPHARHESAFAKIGDRLILAGGRGVKAVDIYDPQSNTWTKGAPPPEEVHHFQALDRNGELWALGAFTGSYPGETPLPHVLIYDLEEDAWRRGPEIPEDRRRGSTGAALVDGQIYIAGGAQDGHRGGHVAWLDRLDPETGTWTRLADAPHARDHAALVAADDKLFFVGGRRSMAPKNTFGAVVPQVDVYDIALGTWATLPDPMPNPRAGVAAVRYGGDVLVIGGESGAAEDAYNNVDALGVETGQWRKAPALRRARHGTGAAVHGDRVWIAAGSGARGGSPELNSLERYPK